MATVTIPAPIIEHLTNPDPLGNEGRTNRAWVDPDGVVHTVDLHRELHLDGVKVGYDAHQRGFARLWAYPHGEMGVECAKPLTRKQYAALAELVVILEPSSFLASHRNGGCKSNWHSPSVRECRALLAYLAMPAPKES